MKLYIAIFYLDEPELCLVAKTKEELDLKVEVEEKRAEEQIDEESFSLPDGYMIEYFETEI